MAVYRSQKNISFQGEKDDKPVLEGDFDFDTREWVYDLSAADEKRFAEALLAEGAVKSEEKPTSNGTSSRSKRSRSQKSDAVGSGEDGTSGENPGTGDTSDAAVGDDASALSAE